MNLSDMPPRFPIPFANNAGASYIRAIPQAHQSPSPTDAPASLYDGFPPETFTPESSGGIPPNGKDFNGLLKQLSQWARWAGAGAPAIYDSTWSTAAGGYPKFARLHSATYPGLVWESTADGNTTDPDGGSPANWIAVSRWRQSGTLSATITAGNQYTITFPTAFPNALVSYAITPINLTGVATRDNWLQRVSLARTGITFVVQGSVTGGDNTLDGVDWWAEGQ